MFGLCTERLFVSAARCGNDDFQVKGHRQADACVGMQCHGYHVTSPKLAPEQEACAEECETEYMRSSTPYLEVGRATPQGPRVWVVEGLLLHTRVVGRVREPPPRARGHTRSRVRSKNRQQGPVPSAAAWRACVRACLRGKDWYRGPQLHLLLHRGDARRDARVAGLEYHLPWCVEACERGVEGTYRWFVAGRR